MLIGEALYPVYIRQLRLWLIVVVPLLAAITTFGAVLANEPTVGSVVVGMLRGGAAAVLQVFFWVTTVFGLMERFGPGDHPHDGGVEPRGLGDSPVAVATPSTHRGTQL